MKKIILVAAFLISFATVKAQYPYGRIDCVNGSLYCNIQIEEAIVPSSGCTWTTGAYGACQAGNGASFTSGYYPSGWPDEVGVIYRACWSTGNCSNCSAWIAKPSSNTATGCSFPAWAYMPYCEGCSSSNPQTVVQFDTWGCLEVQP